MRRSPISPLAMSLALFCAAVLSPRSAAAVDLAEKYPATRTWSEFGLATVCTAEDVWNLRSFEIRGGQFLKVQGGHATVAFGRDGTDVLWAVVLPDRPHTSTITGSLAPQREQVQSLTLRFAPSEISRVFPPETIIGRGDPWRRYEAQRIAARKMVWRWCTPAGNPTIVPKAITLVDIDTVQGPRRFWMLDRENLQAQRVDEFIDAATPPLKAIGQAEALAAFDEIWQAFDEQYAKFIDLPHVNWPALGETYRIAAADADTTFLLAAIISDMLVHLRDLHVWVRADDDWLPGFTRERPLNANWDVIIGQLQQRQSLGKNIVHGRGPENIGYVAVHGLADQQLPEHVDQALEALRDTDGLIVDLRFNGGGDELLGRAVAGRFIDQPVLYSRNQYRSGPKHDDLGPVLDRIVEPRGPWQYDKPVVCLFGPRTLSSAESLAAMFNAMDGDTVTTLGDFTGGSSANPRQLSLNCGIVVNLPRWRDLLPDGTPIEGRGVPPRVRAQHEAEAFIGDDPVFTEALKLLGSKRSPDHSISSPDGP